MSSFHVYHYVVGGQLIGFTIIFLFSALGILLGTFISLEYISLIGFLPLLMGIYELYKVIQFWYSKYHESSLGYKTLHQQRRESVEDPLNDSILDNPALRRPQLHL